MVLSRDRDAIFTANRESNTVSVVDGAAAGPPDWRVTAIPAGGEYPEGLDLSPDGAELWTATRNDGGYPSSTSLGGPWPSGSSRA